MAGTRAVSIPLPERQSRAYVYLISTVAATAGLLFGFDIAVINGAMLFLRQQFALSDFQTEIAAGSLLLGCAAGASIAGRLSDSFGRRRILRVAALLFAVSSLATALPRNLTEFVFARLAAGVATRGKSLEEIERMWRRQRPISIALP